MYTAELFTGGVSSVEIEKRARRVRDQGNKRTCKGQGCITKISAYNRNAKGKLEVLCYKCRSLEDRPPQVPDDLCEKGSGVKDGWVREKCSKGHFLAKVGTHKSGDCAACAKEAYKRRTERQREEEGRPYCPRDSYRPVPRFREFVDESGIGYREVSKATGIPLRTLQNYSEDGAKCPPYRVEMIAEYLQVSPEELRGRSSAFDADE